MKMVDIFENIMKDIMDEVQFSFDEGLISADAVEEILREHMGLQKTRRVFCGVEFINCKVDTKDALFIHDEVKREFSIAFDCAMPDDMNEAIEILNSTNIVADQHTIESAIIEDSWGTMWKYDTYKNGVWD